MLLIPLLLLLLLLLHVLMLLSLMLTSSSFFLTYLLPFFLDSILTHFPTLSAFELLAVRKQTKVIIISLNIGMMMAYGMSFLCMSDEVKLISNYS